ncbi:MAG: prepilin peptidase [Bacilli bacterium]|nr:prepilin peptidase [Bacilli bacterium]MDD4547535.1 prepilin peptidase [Bacilli bacterium]
MELYYIITFFLFGITLGSFYNVVGYRLPKGESIISPPSHCTNCNHQLTAIELIPIFSYIFQGGKCKNCKIKISLFYPFFEFVTGLLFVIAYLVFGLSIELFIALTFISMTLIIFLSDYLYYIISDEVLIVSSVLLMIGIFLLKDIDGLLVALFNGAVAFGIMYLIKQLGDFLFKKESMGGGDIKLLFIFGLVFGWEMALIAIFLASFIGLPISIFMLATNPNKDRIIPFGPFLCSAALIILLLKIDINVIINLLMM